MKNINKNLIFGVGIALTILAIFAIGSILMPTKALAMVYGGNGNANWCANCTAVANDTNNDYPTQVIPVYKTIYQTQPVVYQTQPVYQKTYSNPPQATTSTTDVSKEVSTGTTTDDYSNLAASSLFGGFSFMPSGLMQWILLAIFILMIVILVRKVSGRDVEYHSTPLKHA